VAVHDGRVGHCQLNRWWTGCRSVKRRKRPQGQGVIRLEDTSAAHGERPHIDLCQRTRFRGSHPGSSEDARLGGRIAKNPSASEHPLLRVGRTQPRGQDTSGSAFDDRQRLTPLGQNPDHDVLQRVPVLAENQIAQALVDRVRRGLHGRPARFCRRAFRGDSQRDRGLTGRNPDGGHATAADQVGQHGLDRAFAGAEAMDRPMTDHAAVAAGHGGQGRPNGRRPHVAHLGRDAGQGEDARRVSAGPGHLDVDPRRRAVRVRDDAAASREHRLHHVSLRHLAATPGEQRPDLLHHSLVANQFDAADFGQTITREIVGRGPQPARAQNDIRPRDGLPERLGAGLQIIADRRVKQCLDSQIAKLLAEPLAVRVQPLTAGQFVTDGNDFGSHLSSALPG